MINFKNKATTLGVLAIALSVIVIIPLYIDYEHDKALSRAAVLEEKSMRKWSPPGIKCVDGVAWFVSHQNSGIEAMGAILGKNPSGTLDVVRCDGGYSLTGVEISEAEVYSFVKQANLQGQIEKKRRKGGVPTYDPATIEVTERSTITPNIDFGEIMADCKRDPSCMLKAAKEAGMMTLTLAHMKAAVANSAPTGIPVLNTEYIIDACDAEPHCMLDKVMETGTYTDLTLDDMKTWVANDAQSKSQN